MHFVSGSDKIKITNIYSSNERSDMMKNLLSKVFIKKERKSRLNFVKIILTASLMNKQLPIMVNSYANPRIQYKEYECLSECKLCKKTPYAKVNGQIMSGEDSQDLLNQLHDELK